MKTKLLILLSFLIVLNSRAQDSLSYLIIRNAPDGGGREVQNWIRLDDGIIKLYCAGYNENGNFIGNPTARWM